MKHYWRKYFSFKKGVKSTKLQFQHGSMKHWLLSFNLQTPFHNKAKCKIPDQNGFLFSSQEMFTRDMKFESWRQTVRHFKKYISYFPTTEKSLCRQLTSMKRIQVLKCPRHCATQIITSQHSNTDCRRLSTWTALTQVDCAKLARLYKKKKEITTNANHKCWWTESLNSAHVHKRWNKQKQTKPLKNRTTNESSTRHQRKEMQVHWI